MQAIVKQQVNKAASGDSRAAQFVIGLTQLIEAASAEAGNGPLSSEADEQLKREFMERIRKVKSGKDDE